jgi:hypothetical protein
MLSSTRLPFLAATQRPTAVPCIREAAAEPARSTNVAEEDQVINPETRQFIVGRMGAKTRSCSVDHAPLVFAPCRRLDLFEKTDQQWDDAMAFKLHSARRLTLRS